MATQPADGTVDVAADGAVNVTVDAARVLAVLDEFAGAWNRGDLDRLASLLTDDCVFLASFGPELDGAGFRGRAAVLDAIAGMLRMFPGGGYERTEALVDGNRAFIAWTFSYPTSDGGTGRVRGCDLFEVEDSKIRRKDAFRKLRAEAGSAP